MFDVIQTLPTMGENMDNDTGITSWPNRWKSLSSPDNK